MKLKKFYRTFGLMLASVLFVSLFATNVSISLDQEQLAQDQVTQTISLASLEMISVASAENNCWCTTSTGTIGCDTSGSCGCIFQGCLLWCSCGGQGNCCS